MGAIEIGKYKAQKAVIDGQTFDSRKEANRWCELKLMEKAGIIRDLERQKRYQLLPVQKNQKGEIVEKAIYYVADFVYMEHGRLVVEDAKGVRTREYIIKRKLMLYRYGIRIKET